MTTHSLSVFLLFLSTHQRTLHNFPVRRSGFFLQLGHFSCFVLFFFGVVRRTPTVRNVLIRRVIKKKKRETDTEREREREREKKSEDDGGPIFLREEKSEQKPGRDCR